MLTAVLLLASVAAFAQPVQDNSLQQAKYRTEIGLDLSVPDFNTKAIDAKVMGTRLAGVLHRYIRINMASWHGGYKLTFCL